MIIITTATITVVLLWLIIIIIIIIQKSLFTYLNVLLKYVLFYSFVLFFIP